MKKVLFLTMASVAVASNIRNSRVLGATGSAATGSAETEQPLSATGDAEVPQTNKNAVWLNNIKDAVADLTTFTEKKSQERDKTCKLEFDSITKEAAQQDEDEKNDRAAQKAGLADALDARVAGMGKAMNKLVKLQEQLKRHIDNVNSIFQAKYAQDQKDMVVAQEAFEQLMNHATEGNPKDKPIKVPLMPKLDLGLLDIGTGVFAERMSSMQTRLNKHLSMTDGEPQCADAHDSALALFHKGARQHEEIKQFFDAERSVLAAFREQLANVLRSKMAKMAKLKEQAKKIRSASKIPEIDMKKALGDALAAHSEIIHAACKQMDQHAASNGPKRAALIKRSNECSEQTGNGAGVKIGKESLSGVVGDMEKEVQDTRKESGATGAPELPTVEKSKTTEIKPKPIVPETEKGGNVITV